MNKRLKIVNSNKPVPMTIMVAGEEYYLTVQAIIELGLTSDVNDPHDNSFGGKMLGHLLSSYQMPLYFAPFGKHEYSYYVKKTDVDRAKELMAEGIPFMQSKAEVDVECFTLIPENWPEAKEKDLLHRVFPPR